MDSGRLVNPVTGRWRSHICSPDPRGQRAGPWRGTLCGADIGPYVFSGNERRADCAACRKAFAGPRPEPRRLWQEAFAIKESAHVIRIECVE